MSFAKINSLLISILLIICSVSSVRAGSSSIYFTAIAEVDNSNQPQIVLEWGVIDGEMPDEISDFKLYRSSGTGDHALLADLPYTLVSVEDINRLLKGDLLFRTERLLDNLDRISISRGESPITIHNAPTFLHDMLDPDSPQYKKGDVMLLSRSHLSASRAQGLAYIDASVTAGQNYHYILTAVTVSGETLPIGQAEVADPGRETILPAPANLMQVTLSSCDPLGGGLDHNAIHMHWDVPNSPKQLALNSVLYGYDVFWSATNHTDVDFRDGIPSEFHRVNREPVVISGSIPDSGPDSSILKDSANNHTGTASEPAWEPGQSYYYYLTSVDIAGHYSAPVSSVEMTVADTVPPRTVWNAHVSEIKDPVDNISPRLALTWDAPTAQNFVRYYGNSRTICSSSQDEVCWVGPEQSCTTDTVSCADLDVAHYRVFRFDSPASASHWGIDTDGDGWPDDLDTAPCDPAVPPQTSKPQEWIATIDPGDSQFIRQISETHDQIIFIDNRQNQEPASNHVYWYKVIAVDDQGNQSPLSPPLRGVLYDRNQPDPQATVSEQVCTFDMDHSGDCLTAPFPDDVLVIRDSTGQAASYQLQQFCKYNVNGTTTRLLASGPLLPKGVHISSDDLPEDSTCLLAGCEGGRTAMVSFFDKDGVLLYTTPAFDLSDTCTFNACITMTTECLWETIPDQSLAEDGELQVCVSLEEGQSARIYYETPDNMSALHTFPTASSAGETCTTIFLGTITTSDTCLAVRTFSKNHIGSPMKRIGCYKFPGAVVHPPAPILDLPVSEQTQEGDFFRLHWSIPMAGVHTFSLAITSFDGESSIENLWNIQVDDTGRFPYSFPLTPDELGKQWCFRVRALTTDMQPSPWSNERCETWHPKDLENLPWPPVTEPVENDSLSLGAFYLQTDNDHRPVLVLSKDLSENLARLDSCTAPLPECTAQTAGIPCLRDTEFQFLSCPVCDTIKTTMRTSIGSNDFIVYRQESGSDFVQISPLIEGINCNRGLNSKLQPLNSLQDPFITFLDIDPSVVLGVDNDPAGTGAGVRVLFKDRYPFTAGSTIRYKLVSINPDTGEPEKVFTSNWVNIP